MPLVSSIKHPEMRECDEMFKPCLCCTCVEPTNSIYDNDYVTPHECEKRKCYLDPNAEGGPRLVCRENVTRCPQYKIDEGEFKLQ